MATVTTREAYFDKGLEVLADQGYGGLKLAEVCRRLGVTTGSFYHYFENWADYTRQLVEHWGVATQRRVEHIASMPDSRARIDAIIDVGLHLPHGAEAAIRVWSSINPQVRAAQEEVDRQRYAVIHDSALDLLHDDRLAELYAKWSVYLLVGYEQCTLAPDTAGLAWIIGQWADTIDARRSESAPPAE